jgi:hypothetical protein
VTLTHDFADGHPIPHVMTGDQQSHTARAWRAFPGTKPIGVDAVRNINDTIRTQPISKWLQLIPRNHHRQVNPRNQMFLVDLEALPHPLRWKMKSRY